MSLYWIVTPAQERKVGLSPGQSLNMRGMFNLALVLGRSALTPEIPAFAGMTAIILPNI
jgi:hypothetical protein